LNPGASHITKNGSEDPGWTVKANNAGGIEQELANSMVIIPAPILMSLLWLKEFSSKSK
jgi:hypothetical protein